jgi:hypothetical protein
MKYSKVFFIGFGIIITAALYIFMSPEKAAAVVCTDPNYSTNNPTTSYPRFRTGMQESACSNNAESFIWVGTYWANSTVNVPVSYIRIFYNINDINPQPYTFDIINFQTLSTGNHRCGSNVRVELGGQTQNMYRNPAAGCAIQMPSGLWVDKGMLQQNAAVYGPDIRYVDLTMTQLTASSNAPIRVVAFNWAAKITTREQNTHPVAFWSGNDPSNFITYVQNFKTSCNIPNGNSVPITLRWFDADWGAPPQGLNVFIMYLVDDTTGAHVTPPGGLRSDSYPFGGDNAYGSYNVNIIAGHRYRWIWSGIQKNNGLQVFMPFSEILYNINCQPPTPPTCSISNAIISGGFRLTWNSTNATSASISGIGAVGGSGSTNVGASNATYTMSVSGPGGSASCSTTTVVPAPPRCISFSFSVVGTNYRLAWSSSSATSASISGIGGVPLSGTRDVAQSAATYTLTLTNSIGAIATCSVSTPAPPSCTMTDDFVGGQTRISWNSSGAVSMSINNGIGNVGLSGGPRVVSVAVTTTFTGTVANSVGATRTCDTTVIPPPTINITSSSCDQITFSFTGENYNYNIELLVNGSPVGVSRNNQRAPGSVTFNEVAQFRDFDARNLSARITNVSEPILVVTSANVSIGPCMSVACAGVSVAPAVLEINTPFTITASFTTNIQMGSRGNPQNYSVNAGANPVIAGIPSPIGTGAINSTIASLSYSETSSNIPGPGAIGTYSISYSIVVAGNTTNCPPITINFAEIPYIQAFGGSVISGFGIRDTNTGVCSVGAGTVRSTIVNEPGSSTEYVGSGTQTEVMARGAVNGFRSAITETNRNTTPWSRIFSNTSPGRTATAAISTLPLGGSLSASLCADDWFKDLPPSSAAIAAGANINLNSTSGVVRYNGNKRFTGPSTNITGFRKVFVDGNVIIGEQATPNQSYTYSTSWNSVADIPMTIIIATGNIVIDDNVNNFDGILVARGTVFTCSDTAGVLPNSAGNISQNSAAQAGGGCYNNQLTINGAVVSTNTRLWRTGGTISENVAGPSDAYQGYANGLTSAETFRLSPDVFLSLRPGEEPTNGESGRRPFNSLVTLPPPF